MAEAGIAAVGGDARCCLPQPLAHAAVGIVVEAVHAARTHTVFQRVAVPTFPDGGRTVVDGVKPARVLALEKQVVGDVRHPVLGERAHENGRAEEASLKAVAVVIHSHSAFRWPRRC